MTAAVQSPSIVEPPLPDNQTRAVCPRHAATPQKNAQPISFFTSNMMWKTAAKTIRFGALKTSARPTNRHPRPLSRCEGGMQPQRQRQRQQRRPHTLLNAEVERGVPKSTLREGLGDGSDSSSGGRTGRTSMGTLTLARDGI
jgi:hypothetical protein